MPAPDDKRGKRKGQSPRRAIREDGRKVKVIRRVINTRNNENPPPKKKKGGGFFPTLLMGGGMPTSHRGRGYNLLKRIKLLECWGGKTLP